MPRLRRYYPARLGRCPHFAALLIATVAAATLSTAVQVVLWLVFTDAWPAVLYRDARLAAALVMGPSVLPPPASFDLVVMAVATAVHCAVSLLYTALVARLVEGRSAATATLLGAVFGLALYAVNMHGFTAVFPWFAQARGWITVAAHVAFGMVAAVAWVMARVKAGDCRVA